MTLYKPIFGTARRPRNRDRVGDENSVLARCCVCVLARCGLDLMGAVWGVGALREAEETAAG